MTDRTKALDELIAGDADLYDVPGGAMTPEQCVMVCPQCEGEGTYADGLDDAACSTICTRCEGNGWIVDVHSYNYASAKIVGDLVMTEQLKPCPFCGSRGMIAATLDDMYRPMCERNGCCALDGEITRTEAIAAWNTRPTPADVQALVGALTLAANRLDRVTIEAIVSGDERMRCELRRWSDEARAALAPFRKVAPHAD